MSSDKDDVKGTEPEESKDETAVDTPIDTQDDDPSLEDVDMPVATEEEIAEAEKKVAEISAVGDSDGGDKEPPAGGEDTPDSDDPDAEDAEEEAGQMSLLDHLGELRVRLTRSFIAIAVGMGACYGFADKMFDILMQPMIDVFQKQAAEKPMLQPEFFQNFRQLLTDSMAERGYAQTEQIDLFINTLQQSLMQIAQEGHFQYTYPAEAFFSHIKIAIVAGIFLVSPYVFAQIWGFIAPGLYSHERKWMIPMAMVSALFFTGGAMFGYFQVFPYAFDFFAGFSTDGIQFTPKLNEYLSFCLKLLFAFGFVFELPLFIFFLARMGMVSSAGLRKKRKYAILIGFVLAAVLTPPDPFTQCLMAGPLIVLYEVGIWVAYFFGKKEKRHLKKQAEEEAAAQAELDKAAEQADEPEKQAEEA
ncbi:twin-arginine translocase subunit TatC [Pseudodesulfovibrio sp.]|nr:twin-arginine translocase subunit TatC [Pseudodesulfovibrio sp.]